MCETVPESKPNQYAAEGTVFHRIISLSLRHGFEPIDFEGLELKADGFTFEVGDEMIDHAYNSIDRIDFAGGKLYIEERVSLERWIPKSIDPDTGGTLDVGHAGKEWITIFDWKYGSGVKVDAFKNVQAMSYGLGFWDNIARHVSDARKFRFIIDQPRIPGGGGEYECDLDELMQFGKKLARAAERTTEKNAPLIPGDTQCSWCPARSNCPAYDKFSMDAMALKFDDLDADADLPPLLPAQEMNAKRRAYIVKHADMIRTWLDDIHDRVMDDAMSGVKGIGYKVVDGRHPHSKWTNEQETEKILLRHLSRDEVFRYKLISPAQFLKKKLKAEITDILEDYIDRGEPKPVLVPEDDPRESIRTIADKFDVLT